MCQVPPSPPLPSSCPAGIQDSVPGLPATEPTPRYRQGCAERHSATKLTRFSAPKASPAPQHPQRRAAPTASRRAPLRTGGATPGKPPATAGHRGSPFPAPPLLGARRQRGAAGAALAAGARGLGAFSAARLHPVSSAAPARPPGRHDSRAPGGARDPRRALPLAGAPRAMETAGSARARP